MPNLESRFTRRTSPGLAACVAAAAVSPLAGAYPTTGAVVSAADQGGDRATTLRAQGPAGLVTALAHYDRAPAGAERDRLALLVDQVAAQRYATVSRLYWYTDLAQAESAARTSHRPILALRMLGRLDEDLSCANSRLFRATLYSNADVAKFLRENFVLYWSSERAVPKVTIDFGDGRKIERTTTGNSAHYVLDADGNVLDVLPGLYAPAIFKQELGKSLAFAKQVRGVSQAKLVAARAAHHRAIQRATDKTFRGVAGGRYTPSKTLVEPLRRAQAATMAKARIEMPDLKQIGLDAGAIDPDDVAQWGVIGTRMWKIGGDRKPFDAVPATLGLFDRQSVELIGRLHTAGGALPAANLDDIVARLEHTVVAESALNELQLRQRIRERLATSTDLTFDPLNAWIYAEVFHTPKSDAWLGLLGRTDFSGLPGDGVVMP